MSFNIQYSPGVHPKGKNAITRDAEANAITKNFREIGIKGESEPESVRRRTAARQMPDKHLCKE
jgi:hypothetical protein